MKYIAGYIQLSLQMFNQLVKDKCVDRSADYYALTGARLLCVCNQHEVYPPLPPILTEDLL